MNVRGIKEVHDSVLSRVKKLNEAMLKAGANEMPEKIKTMARLRWAELALSIGAAVITSAVATYGTVSYALGELHDKVNEHDRRMILMEKVTNENSVNISSLLARQNGADRSQIEILDRVKSLDAKIDTLLTRSRRE